MKTSKVIACSALLVAAFGAQSAPADEEPAKATAGMSAGMRVYIDPATGRFTDKPVTEEQRRAAAEGIDTGPLAPMVETRYPDGTVGVELNGHFEMASKAVIGPDGKLTRVCDDAAHGALGEHAHPVAAASQRREEK